MERRSRRLEQENMRRSGKVFICGAGPGDPKLITVKAMEVLVNCDLVLYDRLVSKEIIDLIPSSTMRFNVGRAGGTSAARQDKTNTLMVESARRGKKRSEEHTSELQSHS